MLVSVDTLKEYLGLPPAADPAIDPVLERSSRIAQTLAESYVGTPLEQDPSVVLTHTRYQLAGARVIRLPQFPTMLSSVKVDDVALVASEYTFDSRMGVFEFTMQRSSVAKLEIQHVPGFTPEDVPKDLEEAITNMAIGIYENGGKISTSNASGALKSMTMFDAMSMSFDTGTSTGSAGTPEGIVSQWAFVLDKYDVDRYAMGGL